MVSFFIQGISDVLTPNVLMWIFLGSVISTFLGIIPVLGGELGVTLLIPFITGMNPVMAMPFLLAIDAVSCTGGSVTSILLNVPGTLINAATSIDGYPMTLKGQAGRAIGAALTSSAIGGILTVPLALLMIPLLVPFILLFKSPEMFLLIVCGLFFLSVLTTKDQVVKGLISAVLGLMLATVGAQAETGVGRFTFKIAHLYEGLPLIIIVLGMFAVPSLIALYAQRKAIAPIDNAFSIKESSQMRQGALDVWRHKWLALKSMIVGYIVGIIPGIGAFTSTFLVYGMAKRSSKHPEEFGKGSVEGVIAPEAANNAKEAGGLLTTMAFGIPGTGTMAIIMAALMVLGLQPGPTMLTQNTALCITMLTSIAIANVFAVVMVWFGAPYLTRVTQIKPQFLFATIIPLVFLGAFAESEIMFDTFAVVVAGVIGTCMKRYGYSAPSLILGFVLGGDLEYFLWKSLDGYGPTFVFSSGISTVLFLLCVSLLFNKPIVKLFKNLQTARKAA